MSAPALKVTQYLKDLDDRTRPMSEFELHAIIKDCERALRHVSSQDAVSLRTAMALAAMRLGRHEDACYQAQCAMKLDPNNDICKLNLGVALIDVGKHHEAIELFASLSGSSVVAEYLILSNMAECLARIGLHDDACSAFNDALGVADLSNPRVLFDLAVQAALIDADDAALELAVRAIARHTNIELGERPPIEVIDQAPISLRQAIDQIPALRMAIQRARVFGGIPRNPPSITRLVNESSAEERELADREALAVFEAMKSLRARANQAVLAEAENG